jgi:hypothetical protein
MGWGKGKGSGPHHHHRGPGVGLIAAEAAVVGAVAGATVASVAARPPPRKPKPWEVYRGPEDVVIKTRQPAPAPVVVCAPRAAQAQPVVVVSGTYPKAKPYSKFKPKGKVTQSGVVVDSTPPLSISSISMQLQHAEIRGITYFYAVDVVPESGNPWRVMRSYNEFQDLFSKLGRQTFPTAPFPHSLDKMALGDGRSDFGLGIGTCFYCKAKCRNRGDKESRTVYCSTCYPLRFPDTPVLQSQQRQLESWLQNVIQHLTSRGAWMSFLRGFLEAGREFIPTSSVQDAAASIEKASPSKQPALSPSPAQAAYVQSSPKPAPMPTSSEPAVEQHHEQGELMSIEIPAGVIAGQIIAITVPNGNQVHLTLTEGQNSGDIVTLLYDSVAGTLTPVTDSEEQSESDQQLSIEVPAGVNSGQLIAITVPDGRQIQFTVPEGKKSGDQLDLWFDSASGTLMPLL